MVSGEDLHLIVRQVITSIWDHRISALTGLAVGIAVLISGWGRKKKKLLPERSAVIKKPAPETKFVVRIDGVSANRLIKFEGARGPFYLTVRALDPENGRAYFYGDADYQFIFYVSFVPGRFLVHLASNAHGDISPVSMKEEDLPRIEENILHVFKNHEFTGDFKPLPKPAEYDTSFEWSRNSWYFS